MGRTSFFAHVTLCLLMTSVCGVKVVDLTFELGPSTVFWPGVPPFNFTILMRGEQKSNGRMSAIKHMEVNSFSTAEHGGTHVDAPAHFCKGCWRAHEIPASNLVGPAVVIDVSHKAASDPDYRLNVDDIQTWEATHGRIPDRSVVLMNSGRDILYPNPKLVFGTDDPTDPSTFHFPGIHPHAAVFLAEQRHVVAVGVDSPSTDYGQTRGFETHIVLAERNVLGLENVRNVGQLPPRGATVVIGLVRLRDGSGGPARLLALVDDGANTEAGSIAILVASGMVALFLVLYIVIRFNRKNVSVQKLE